MNSKVDHAPRRGRPLSDDVRRSVYAAALDGLGHGTPSITAIAHAAGVSRQTIYNRWRTVPDLLLDALLERAADTIGTGRPSSLRSYLTDLAEAIEGWARPGLRAVVGAALDDEEFARRFRADFLEHRHRGLTAAVEHQRADADDGVTAEAAAELIASSMWHRVLVTDRPLDDAWVDEMVAIAAGAAAR